jgi:hypothetical protein
MRGWTNQTRANQRLLPAALTGFIVNPLWYAWLGGQLRNAEGRPEKLTTTQAATGN